jgi:predicted component of type VI protein secretion system
MSTFTDAMRTALGRVRVRPLRATTLLGASGGPVPYADVLPPGALVGRGDRADIRVADAGGHVSRVHVMIEPYGLQWVVRDAGSAHGTVLLSGSGRVPLPQHVPYPIATGDEVVLASVAILALEVLVAAPGGVRTADAPPPKSRFHIDDPVLAELAHALLEPRRRRPGSQAVASAQELAERFAVNKRTIYRRLEKLGAIDQIGRHLPAGRNPPRQPSPTQYADAIAIAFPLLAIPGRDDRP